MYDRSYCRKIDSVREKLNQVLKEVGLEIVTSRITYGEKLTVKYEFRDPGNTVAALVESNSTKFFCSQHGLPENIVGMKFQHKRSTYEVTTVDPDKPKRSIILKRLPDGKTFVGTPAFVRSYLG